MSIIKTLLHSNKAQPQWVRHVNWASLEDPQTGQILGDYWRDVCGWQIAVCLSDWRAWRIYRSSKPGRLESFRRRRPRMWIWRCHTLSEQNARHLVEEIAGLPRTDLEDDPRPLDP